jgi:hypothetical protein
MNNIPYLAVPRAAAASAAPCARTTSTATEVRCRGTQDAYVRENAAYVDSLQLSDTRATTRRYEPT